MPAACKQLEDEVSVTPPRESDAAPEPKAPLWHWKAGLLSALFRVALFAIAAPPHDAAGLRGVAIQLGFRALCGGFWGSSMQAIRAARPSQAAAAAIVIAALGQLLEYAAMRLGQASHIKTGMVVSGVVSGGSLLINWGLMRRGLLLAGKGSATLRSDLRRLPATLRALLTGGFSQ